MSELNYIDLLKAHKMFREIEGRWKFYDAYMNKTDLSIWMKSPDVPLDQAMLLFGFIQSWDSNFQGNLTKFLNIYRKSFPIITNFSKESLISINLSKKVKNDISNIFDAISCCPNKQRHEYTDTSKILHAILPNLFVMWDIAIRNGYVGEECDGKCYGNIFMPKMQELAIASLDSFLTERGGDYKSASQQISLITNGSTLAKLIDEFNYVRFTKRKSLEEIRSISLNL